MKSCGILSVRSFHDFNLQGICAYIWASCLFLVECHSSEVNAGLWGPVVLEHMPVVQSPAVLGTGERESEQQDCNTVLALAKPKCCVCMHQNIKAVVTAAGQHCNCIKF